MVLHERFVDRKRSKSEEELLKRLEESVTTAKKDLELLREIWIEFSEWLQVRLVLRASRPLPETAYRGLPRPTEWNDVVRLQVGSLTPCAPLASS